jgi:hypothetical protein
MEPPAEARALNSAAETPDNPIVPRIRPTSRTKEPMPIVPLVLAVIGLIFLRPLLRVVTALVAGPAVGQSALATQPDRIELREAGRQAWQDGGAADRQTEPLLLLGYEQAGTFTIPQMPGVVLRLMVHLRECVLGIVYEHPQSGRWVELATRYAGGTTFTVTSSVDHGLASRPGHPVMHLAGTAPGALHSRLLALRPSSGTERIEAGRAAEVFEQGYAEAMAWRKSQGVSRAEVVRVAVRGVKKQKAA